MAKKAIGIVGAGLDILAKKEQLRALGEGVISKNNALALGAVGVFIGMVGYHSNGKKLFSELSNEKQFLKFGAAIMILNYSIENFLSPELRTIAKSFMWIGLLLSASDDNLITKIENYFK